MNIFVLLCSQKIVFCCSKLEKSLENKKLSEFFDVSQFFSFYRKMFILLQTVTVKTINMKNLLFSNCHFPLSLHDGTSAVAAAAAAVAHFLSIHFVPFCFIAGGNDNLAEREKCLAIMSTCDSFLALHGNTSVNTGRLSIFERKISKPMIESQQFPPSVGP